MRVRGVDDVVGKAKAKVTSYSARGRLKRLCRPYHYPHGVDRVVALQYARNHGAGADERHELAKERLVLVDRVELLSLLLGKVVRLQVLYLEALLLEPCQDLACQLAAEPVRLDYNKRLLDCHFSSTFWCVARP